MTTNTIAYIVCHGHSFKHVAKIGGNVRIDDGEAILVFPAWGAAMTTVASSGVEVMGPPAPEFVIPAKWAYVSDDLASGVYKDEFDQLFSPA